MEEDAQNLCFFYALSVYSGHILFEVRNMSELLTQFRDNLSFVGVCILIIAVLGFGAKYCERFLPGIRKVSSARRVSIIGICSAIAAVLHMLDFPLLLLAPGFYKLDFSELPVLLCGFYLGPTATVICEGIKILLKLMIKSTSTAFVGDFANFVVGCSFVLPATIWYHIHKSKHAAVIGLVLGTLSMSVFGSAFNAVYLLPKFSELYGLPLENIIAMGAEIRSGIHNVTTFVMLCVAPLNLVKGITVSILTMLLYKRVARPLFGLHK
jgi:riboflavin transporter FmnP